MAFEAPAQPLEPKALREVAQNLPVGSFCARGPLSLADVPHRRAALQAAFDRRRTELAQAVAARQTWMRGGRA